MVQVQELTKEQKVEMYMKFSKEELIEMLIENQRLLKMLDNMRTPKYVPYGVGVPKWYCNESASVDMAGWNIGQAIY